MHDLKLKLKVPHTSMYLLEMIYANSSPTLADRWLMQCDGCLQLPAAGRLGAGPHRPRRPRALDAAGRLLVLQRPHQGHPAALLRAPKLLAPTTVAPESRRPRLAGS